MIFHPIDDNVLIRPIQVATKKPSLIIEVDAPEEENPYGVVVAVGPGCKVDGKVVPVSVNIGDKVFYRTGPIQEVELFGQTLRMIREPDIMATVSGEPESQRQDSLEDQLKDVRQLAIAHGCYDADDFIRAAYENK